MFKFKQTFPSPKEKSKGVNSCEFIIVHHTATGKGTTQGVINGLAYRDDFASCHFLIGDDGNAYKFGDPKEVLWHAGVSKWGKLEDMNVRSIGIEVVGPIGTGKDAFTDGQRKLLRELLQHLMAAFSIPPQNVLRHCDVTHEFSHCMMHYQPGFKTRKTDPSDELWKINRTYWAEYQFSLEPKLQ